MSQQHSVPATPEETRERIAKLEVLSEGATRDRAEIKQNVKELRQDVVGVAIGMKAVEVKLDAHFETLKQDHKKENRDAKGILGALGLILTAVAYSLLKQLGIAP